MSTITRTTPSYRFKHIRNLLQKKASLVPLAILVVLSALVYCNSLSNDFVFDDVYQVVKNPWIKDPHYIPQILSSNVWGFLGLKGLNYYRPLVFITYLATYLLFGLAPWAFHGVNVLFHAGITALVFLIASRLFESSQQRDMPSYPVLPFLVALLFATHPIHTEAVTWVAGLADLSFAFFSLLSWYFVMRADSSAAPSKVLRSLSLASFALALLCKETALTLPVILFSYDFLLRREKASLRYFVKRYLPYLGVMGGYFLVRFYALGGFAPHRLHSELTTYQYVINIAPLFSQYLEKLVLPVDLKAFYVFHPVMSFLESNSMKSLAVLAIVVAFGWAAWRKSRLALFSLLLIVIPLLPVLYVPVVGVNTFAERYLYLPSLGYVMFLAALLSWAGLWQAKTWKTISAITVIAAGLYSGGTILRNYDWKDDSTIRADTFKKSPDIASHHKALGALVFAKGLTDEAITDFQLAVAFDPSDAELHNSLGVALEKKGWLEDAITQYRTAADLRPSYADALNNLGNAFMAKGRTDPAIDAYERALAAAPSFADAHNNLGIAYAKKGAIPNAIAEFEAALRLNPTNDVIRDNLAQARKELGQRPPGRGGRVLQSSR